MKAAITKNKDHAQGVLSVNTIIPEKIQISDDETAKKIKIEEESLYGKIYTETYDDICTKSRELFSDFLVNKDFWNILKTIKNNTKYHKKRLLDITKQDGAGKDYYTKAIYDKMSEFYKKRDDK